MTTPSPDYDREAARYDETRGGEARAEAAAAAVAPWLPPGGLVLDVGGGTGLVGARLAVRGFRTVVLDRSAGMLAVASPRSPGRVVCGDATRLPLGDATVDAVLLVWLLHLLPEVGGVLAESARVLRDGGTLVTTVDKAYAHGYRRADPEQAVDARRRVRETAAGLGLASVGEAAFVGVGQTGAGTADPVFPVLVLQRDRRPTA